MCFIIRTIKNNKSNKKNKEVLKMGNKVDVYMHNLFRYLYEDCMDIVKEYEDARKNLKPIPEEYALHFITDTMEDIEKALEVFGYADMITEDEEAHCRYCAKKMRREAISMLRKHIRNQAV